MRFFAALPWSAMGGGITKRGYFYRNYYKMQMMILADKKSLYLISVISQLPPHYTRPTLLLARQFD